MGWVNVMRYFYRENKRHVDRALFLLIFFVFAYFFFKYALGYVMPFVIGFVISLAISPIVGFLQRKLRITRGLVTIILIIAVITLLAIASAALINRVYVEIRYFSESLPEQLESLRIVLYDLEDRFENFMTFVPEEFSLDFNEIVNQLTGAVTSYIGNFAKDSSLNLVKNLPNAILNFFMTMISAFFFTRDKKLIGDAIMKALPSWMRLRAETVQKGFLSAVSGYVKAQLIIMSVIASISILGLTILRYPYSVIMGFVICLTDALPLIGGSLIFWPWALGCLLTGNYTYAAGLLVINAACFFARQILEPKILGQQIGAHPLLVLMSVYLGLKLFGVAGLFLGPAFMVIAKLILTTNAFTEGAAPREPAKPIGIKD